MENYTKSVCTGTVFSPQKELRFQRQIFSRKNKTGPTKIENFIQLCVLRGKRGFAILPLIKMEGGDAMQEMNKTVHEDVDDLIFRDSTWYISQR